MPFTGQVYRFDDATLNRVNEVGGVYGLFAQSGPYNYVARYVGLGDNLRRRLREHFNNPPISGITHFFVEAHPTAIARAARERELIREFNPPGNVHHTR